MLHATFTPHVVLKSLKTFSIYQCLKATFVRYLCKDSLLMLHETTVSKIQVWFAQNVPCLEPVENVVQYERSESEKVDYQFKTTLRLHPLCRKYFQDAIGFQGSFLRGLADILKKYYFVGHHELKAAAKKLYRSVFLIHSSPRGSRTTKRHSNRTARRTLHQGFQLMGQTPCSLASQVASAGHRTISWRLVSEEKQSPPVSPVWS